MGQFGIRVLKQWNVMKVRFLLTVGYKWRVIHPARLFGPNIKKVKCMTIFKIQYTLYTLAYHNISDTAIENVLDQNKFRLWNL